MVVAANELSVAAVQNVMYDKGQWLAGLERDSKDQQLPLEESWEEREKIGATSTRVQTDHPRDSCGVRWHHTDPARRHQRVPAKQEVEQREKSRKDGKRD